MERLSDAVITEEEKQEKEVVIVDTAALIFQGNLYCRGVGVN